MNIKNKRSGNNLEASIEEVEFADYKKIEENENFTFDWFLEERNEVYKIFLSGEDNDILGLISLMDIPEELRIHINLIEVAKIHVGEQKRLDNIAGCLIAFACSIAFKRGYGGFVSFLPKTKLIDLYQDKYGFRQFGRMLAMQFERSKLLIDKYIGDEQR